MKTEYDYLLDPGVSILQISETPTPTPYTLAAYMLDGWRVYDIKQATGYVSKKTDIMNQQVKRVTRGHRVGEYYVEAPHPNSTNAHYRLYLRKEDWR